MTKNTPEPQAWKNRKRQKLAKKETHQPKYKGEKKRLHKRKSYNSVITEIKETIYFSNTILVFRTEKEWKYTQSLP